MVDHKGNAINTRSKTMASTNTSDPSVLLKSDVKSDLQVEILVSKYDSREARKIALNISCSLCKSTNFLQQVQHLKYKIFEHNASKPI